jgi:hypothetical protein
MKEYMMLFIALTVLLPCPEPQGSKQDDSLSPETVALFTDRNLYISGESILFSAFLNYANEFSAALRSRVLYCELITPQGSRIAGGKFIIENNHSAGSMQIPVDLISGNYLLRAYTRIMRNFGPRCYSYTSVKVVNPNRREVQENSGELGKAEAASVDYLTDQHNPAFTITSDNPVYGQRDTAEITIKTDPTLSHSLKGVVLAIVPESTVGSRVKISRARDTAVHEQYYFAEHLGLSLTGKLSDSAGGHPLQYKRVSLSILGSGADFMAVQTDTAGRFFFHLPDYYGRRDLFICAEKEAGTDVDVLVDNDFCTTPVMIATGRFILSEEERAAACRLAVNRQLGSLFYPDMGLADTAIAEFHRPFYGMPDDILSLDDYIELPTLEEYFNGLPALVRVRKSKGGKYFKVLGTQSGLNDFDPLVLIDLVAVDDPGRVLAVLPANISRIEMVNRLYVKGDETYGGIISIFSRHGDFAGIDLPASGIFLNYDFISEDHYQIPPVSSGAEMPDTRNTLYWDPDLRLADDRPARIRFTAPDRTGKYLVVLRCITEDGKIAAESRTFEVIKRK